MEMKKSRGEMRLQELLEAAHKDPNLKMRLLHNPKAVAKEWKVELGDREAVRLQKLGAFVELANEAKFGRGFQGDPTVCYPVTIWFKREILELVKEIVVLIPDPIFYPAPILRRTEELLGQRLGLKGRSRK